MAACPSPGRFMRALRSVRDSCRIHLARHHIDRCCCAAVACRRVALAAAGSYLIGRGCTRSATRGFGTFLPIATLLLVALAHIARSDDTIHRPTATAPAPNTSTRRTLHATGCPPGLPRPPRAVSSALCWGHPPAPRFTRSAAGPSRRRPSAILATPRTHSDPTAREDLPIPH